MSCSMNVLQIMIAAGLLSAPVSAEGREWVSSPPGTSSTGVVTPAPDQPLFELRLSVFEIRDPLIRNAQLGLRAREILRKLLILLLHRHMFPVQLHRAQLAMPHGGIGNDVAGGLAEQNQAGNRENN